MVLIIWPGLHSVYFLYSGPCRVPTSIIYSRAYYQNISRQHVINAWDEKYIFKPLIEIGQKYSDKKTTIATQANIEPHIHACEWLQIRSTLVM